jgi:hypothetical protein
MKVVNASSEWATTFGSCPLAGVSMRRHTLCRAERVLDGSDTNAVSLAAIKALHRVADEAPQVAVFDALKTRLDEIREEPLPLNGPLSRRQARPDP